MKADRPALIFVYNADSGLFNTLSDIAHKVLSPATYACSLCALTHGHFTVKAEWTAFLESLDADCAFMHRDEFLAAYGMSHIAFPAILEQAGAGLRVAVDAATLQACESLDTLKTLLRTRISGHPELL